MRAIIASEVPGKGDLLRQLLLGLGVECGAADVVNFTGLSPQLTQAEADLVLVVLGADLATAVVAIQYVARSGVPVLAVGPASDSQRILQVIRAGVAGYLDENHLRDELIAALEKLRGSKTVVYRPGQALAVLAAAPGSGVTTVAANVAFALAREHPRQVALAELGPGVPGLALNLDLQPEYTPAHLAERWEHMDSSMVRQALVAHAAGVHVLAYKPETLQAAPLPASALRQTVLLLGTLFEYAVLDLGHYLDAACLDALSLATRVLLVLRLDVPSIRLSRQLVRQLTAQGLPGERLRVVANRYGQRKQISSRQASAALGLPIQEWIPDDPGTLNQATNLGAPLIAVARRAAITRSFAHLVRRLRAA